MTSPPWWLRIARRLFPGRVWDGAGVSVDKTYREPYTGDVMVANGRGLDYGSGTVAERWVLVVRDKAREDHYIDVESTRARQASPWTGITACGPDPVNFWQSTVLVGGSLFRGALMSEKKVG